VILRSPRTEPRSAFRARLYEVLAAGTLRDRDVAARAYRDVFTAFPADTSESALGTPCGDDKKEGWLGD